MTAREVQPPYKRLEGRRAFTLEGQNKIDLEVTLSAALEELWNDPDDYVYDGVNFNNTLFSAISTRRAWGDNLYPTQMTFLQLETAKMLQGLHRALFTRDGVRQELQKGKKVVGEEEVERIYARNYLAWQQAQAITLIEQQPEHGPIERAALNFGITAREIGRENIILMGSRYLHEKIAERAKTMAGKHAKLADHIVHAARYGVHHGIGHIKGELLKQLLGGPVGSTISAVNTARSLAFTIDRFLGNRAVFMGNGWQDININSDMDTFNIYYGQLAGSLGRNRLLDATDQELQRFDADFDDPGRTQALILALFLQQPFREQVKAALPATFIREGGDYVLARMPQE